MVGHSLNILCYPIIFFCFLLPSCRTTSSRSTSRSMGIENRESGHRPQSQTEQPEGPDCGNDELISLALSRIDSELEAKDLGFQDGDVMLGAEASNTPVLRIDACSDGETLNFQQAIVRREISIPGFPRMPPEWFLILPDKDSMLNGLSESLLEDDSSRLNITIPYKEGGGFRMGGKKVNGNSVAFFLEEEAANSGRPAPLEVTYGKLEIKDPFPSTWACQQGERPTKETWSFPSESGTVTFELLACIRPDTGFGGGETISWRKLKIVDTNAPGSERGKELNFVKGKSAGINFQHVAGHHNTCTSYSIQLNHATYGITVLAAGGNTGGATDSCRGELGAPDVSTQSTTDIATSINYKGQQPLVEDSAKASKKREVLNSIPE